MDDRLEAYVDGELPAAESERLEAIVAQDAVAARKLELARRVRDELAAAERPSCPPGVTRAVLALARAEAAGRKAERDRAIGRPAAMRRPDAPAARPARLRALWNGRSRSAGRRNVRTVWTEVLRPSLATAALVALVVAAALIGRVPTTPPRDPPATAEATPAEVRQALADARWALAYVSDIGRRTGRSIRQEVLEERVAAPVQRAVGTALDAASDS